MVYIRFVLMTNDTTQSVKDKIDELNEQAWEVRVYDSAKSLELSRDAVELARGIAYHSGLERFHERK